MRGSPQLPELRKDQARSATGVFGISATEVRMAVAWRAILATSEKTITAALRSICVTFRTFGLNAGGMPALCINGVKNKPSDRTVVVKNECLPCC